MWSSWTEKATKGLTDAFEKTGEAITQATHKARQANESGAEASNDESGSENMASSSEKSAAAADVPSSAGADEKDDPDVKDQKKGFGGFQLPSFNVNVNIANSLKTVPNVAAAAADNKDKLLNNIQTGWSSVVETTKRGIDATVEAVEKEQSRIEKHLPFGKKSGFHKRDPKLPLDVEALRDAEVVYITDRIITLSHPAMASSVDPIITGERKLAAVGHLLQRRHDGRFLVWNLSEVEYDVSILDNQVMTFSFPGSPSPPLGLLLKLLVSMENWMRADERNVAVVHCLTGRGRTSTVLAAFLCWMGEAGFHDIQQALTYIAECKQLTTEELTIPSQRRYASYFKNMLDGVRPSQPPLMLKRIIMSEAPKYAKGPKRDSANSTGEGQSTKQDANINSEESTASEEKLMGCAPYMQIFKGGQLVFTTAATLSYQQTDEELPFVQGIDGSVPFNVNQIIQGDILIRCRHLTFSKQRVSMFRAAFHTGYVPPNVMRITKSQLDGACSDKRFPDDFFLDLIFEKVDVETAQKLLEDQEEEAAASKELEEQEEKLLDPRAKKPVVKASSYDSMLHGDSRFWDIIANRRKEQVAQKNDDPMFGPSVGRRRGESKAKAASNTPGGGDDKPISTPKERSQLETFSIGNEFDFLPKPSPTAKPAAVKKQEKDSLMEALMALDEDEGGQTAAAPGTEEIVFDHGEAASSVPPTKQEGTAVSTVSGTGGAEETPSGTGTDEAGASLPEAASSSETQTSIVGDNVDTGGSDDMEALLASADEDLGDIDLSAFDDGDDDITDLEDMLKL